MQQRKEVADNPRIGCSQFGFYANTDVKRYTLSVYYWMNKKDAILPENKALHVILGSHCTHNSNDAWLNKHDRRARSRSTLIPASRLNQMTDWIWFEVLSRNTLKNANFNESDSIQKVYLLWSSIGQFRAGTAGLRRNILSHATERLRDA